jgi:hypothetical protein
MWSPFAEGNQWNVYCIGYSSTDEDRESPGAKCCLQISSLKGGCDTAGSSYSLRFTTVSRTQDLLVAVHHFPPLHHVPLLAQEAPSVPLPPRGGIQPRLFPRPMTIAALVAEVPAQHLRLDGGMGFLGDFKSRVANGILPTTLFACRKSLAYSFRGRPVRWALWIFRLMFHCS